MTLSQSRYYAALRVCGEGWHPAVAVAERLARAASSSSRKGATKALNRLADLGVLERRKEAWNSRTQSRRRWEYRDLHPDDQVSILRTSPSVWAGKPPPAPPTIPPIATPHIEAYMEAVLAMHEWCAQRGLDFRGQMVGAMRQHIKDKDTKP